MKVLITGGAGFIGFHLGRTLVARGARVDLLDNFARGARDADLAQFARSSAVRLIEADLLKPDAAASFDTDYDAVVHLAAIVGVANVLRQPYEVLARNNQLLLNAMDIARRQRELRHFLFTSTSEVYAGTLLSFGMKIPTPESTPLTISNPADVRTSYMLSKIYGEALCHGSGLPVTIVRPHNFYGPRMGLSHVIPELLKRAFEAREPGTLEVYSTEHKRTFCYIDDAVEYLVRLLDRPRSDGRTLNIGVSAPEVTIREVAQVVLDTVGRKLEIKPMPPSPGSPERRAPDISNIIELTGYKPTVDLRTGVAKTFEWYRATQFAPESSR